MLSFTFSTTLLAIATLLLPAQSAPTNFQKSNALDAQKLNAQFATLQSTDACTEGDQACVQNAFAQCVGQKWMLTPCSGGTVCVALPLVNKEGTSLSCDTTSDAIARMQAAGVDASLTGDGSDAPTDVSSLPASTASATAPATSPTDTSDDDDSDCTMDDTATVTSPSTSVASSATPTSTDDGEDEECTEDDENESTTVPAASPTAAGYARRRLLIAPRQVPEPTSISSFTLAFPSVNAAPSGASVPAPSISTLAGSASSSAILPSGTPAPAEGNVQVVTIQTTMFITVTIPQTAAPAPTAVTSSIPGVPSASFPASGASTSVAVASSSGLASPSTLSSVSQSSAVAVPASTSAFSSASTVSSAIAEAPEQSSAISPSFTGRIASTPSVSASSAAVTVRTSSPSTTPPPPASTLDSSDISFLITATL